MGSNLQIFGYIGCGIATLVILLTLYKALEIAYLRHRQRQQDQKKNQMPLFFENLISTGGSRRIECNGNYYSEPGPVCSTPLTVDGERVYEEVKDLQSSGSVYNSLSVPV